METAEHVSYSRDMMKKYAFIDELNNYLRILPIEEIDEKKIIIIEYLENKIKEIDKRNK